MSETFYGTCAVALGAWEVLAWLGHLPTVTETVRSRRHPIARVMVVAWSFGLLRHLTRVST